jgi:hypothetical protein
MSGAGIFLAVVLGIPILCIIVQKVFKKNSKDAGTKDS